MSEQDIGVPSHVAAEVAAVAAVAQALESLDQRARARVLQWASDCLLEIDNRRRPEAVLSTRVPDSPSRPTTLATAEPSTDLSSVCQQEEAAEFLHQSGPPATAPERALVVAAHVQLRSQAGSFKASEVNSELKHLGYAIANITDALASLMNRKPQLVVQMQKSGTSRQARKLYKVTQVGFDTVRQLRAEARSHPA